MSKTLLVLFGFIIFLTPSLLGQQFPNDNCLNAIEIEGSEDFCSLENEFTLEGASFSEVPDPFCWVNGQANADSWYSFKATQTGASISIFGMEDLNETQDRVFEPFVAIYEGSCSDLNEIGCGFTTTNQNVVEQTVADLTLGEIYYIRVGSNVNILTNFQLCIKQFNFVPVPQGDCGSAVILCDTSPFIVESIVGSGNVLEDLGADCFPANSQTDQNSVWYSWVVDQSGSLSFTITPNNISNAREDIDFVLFRLPNGLNDCDEKEVVRCMASGETLPPDGSLVPDNLRCLGPTGLRDSETDLSERNGCDPGDNNFIRSVEMLSGEAYTLVIQNFSETGQGFSIEFGGTGTFLGPVPDFLIEATEEFECDKRIIFDNLSFSDSDPIINWDWNFGAGAVPARAEGPGPHEVIYDSFGPKLIGLTVESEKGCRVTKILDQFIEACCDDNSDLALDAQATDLVCPGIISGRIEALPSGGDPEYTFSLDGINFQRSPEFTGLDIGEYMVFVQDQRGCVDEVTMVFIDEPDEISVDAGPDQFINLGESAQIDADFSSPNPFATVTWSPTDSLSCTDCLNPISSATRTTDYILTIENSSECVQIDTVRITVAANREFFAPNVINPSSGIRDNQIFNIFMGTSGLFVDDLQIWDRWGNIVFSNSEPIVRGLERSSGWDGNFKGVPVNPAVFVWAADLHYLDGEIIRESGTLTVVR